MSQCLREQTIVFVPGQSCGCRGESGDPTTSKRAIELLQRSMIRAVEALSRLGLTSLISIG
jgi:hypothetical protein